MKITLTHPQPFAFTVHTAGVRVEVEGQGAPGPVVPPPVEQPPPVPPPVTGFDTSVSAALLEGFTGLEPIGGPDFADVGPLGTEFTQVVVPGLPAGKSSYRWSCALVPPVDGVYDFT